MIVPNRNVNAEANEFKAMINDFSIKKQTFFVFYTTSITFLYRKEVKKFCKI